MDKSTDLLIVIPCLNEERTLDALVRQLLLQRPSMDMRIVIADGGSTDRTLDIARALSNEFPEVTLMHNPARVQSAAINLAVNTYGTGSTWLIRIDAHADYPADYCIQLIAEAQTHGADSVVVSMQTLGSGFFQKAVADAQNSKLGNGGSAHRSAQSEGKFVDHGHHALMRVEAFRAVGGYDETFTHNEDAELDIRLHNAGYKIWLTVKTQIGYYPRSTVQGLFRQYYNYGRGRVKTILKHKAKPKLRQLLPVAVFPALVLALLTPLCWIGAIPLLLWAALCLGYGLKLGLETRFPETYLSGPAAMIMHLAWSLGFWIGLLAWCKAKI